MVWREIINTFSAYSFLRIVLFTLSLSSKFAHAQFFDISARDVEKMKGRKLLVVLQEENPRLLKQLRNHTVKLEKYKHYIKLTNELLTKLIPKYWSASEYVFKPYTECITLAEFSKDYFTLDFVSLRDNENTELYRLPLDTNSFLQNREHLIQTREFGTFEIRLLERFSTYVTFTWYTPASLPNEYDFTIAILQINNLLKEKFNGIKTNEYEAHIRERNKKLFAKVLLADSSQMVRQFRSFKYTDSLYAARHKIGSIQDMKTALLNKDSATAILVVIPYKDILGRGTSYAGTTGGGMNEYEKTFYFMQIIMDVHTGELLYFDSSEEQRILPRDWKRFLRYSDENKFLIPLSNTKK